MLPRNIIQLFITLLFLLQAPVHGGILRELRRKFVEVWFGKPFQKHGPPGPFYEGCNVCLWGTCTPAVLQNAHKDFDPSADTKLISDALDKSGVVVEKRPLISILTRRNEEQRDAIALHYSKGNGMKEELGVRISKRLTKGSAFQTLMSALVTPIPVFFAQHFEFAMKLMKDQQSREKGRNTIVELLNTLPKCLIDKIIHAYESNQKRDFLSDLNQALQEGLTTKESTEVILKLAKENRDVSKSTSWFKAIIEAYKLKKSVQSQDVEKMLERFSDLFTKRSIPQMKETMTVYENLRYGDKGFLSLYEDIRTNIGSDVKEVYGLMIRLLTNKAFYYAQKIQDILQSRTGDRIEFIGIIRERIGIDLKDIIDEYNKIGNMKKDFDDWDNEKATATFHEAMLEIIQ